MPRTFAYLRVSTEDQFTENQLMEIKAAGYDIPPQRVAAENISGMTPAADRPEFKNLLIKMEAGDTLVVTKVDRLGRSPADVLPIVEKLRAMGVKLIVLQLANVDITSPVGELVFTTLVAFAKMERELLMQRINAGIARAQAEGKHCGRPGINDKTLGDIRTMRLEGSTPGQISRALGIALSTAQKYAKQIDQEAEQTILSSEAECAG